MPENGRAAVRDGAGGPGLPGGSGGAQGTPVQPPPRLTTRTLALFRGEWRGLCGFSLGVALFAALVGCALVAGAFAVNRYNFALTWQRAQSEIAYEDRPLGYFSEQWYSIILRSLPFMGLLVPLAALVLALLHTGCAVAVRDAVAGGPRPGRGSLWRRSRPYVWLGFRVQALTSACAGVPALLALGLWMFLENGGVWDFDFEGLSHATSTPYRLLGYGLPLVLLATALFVWFRLAPATAVAVNGAAGARDAVRRSWSLTGGARRWRVVRVCLPLTALVLAAFFALLYAGKPLAHPVGLAVLWFTHDNPYATGAVMKIVPTTASLLLLTALVMPPVSTALALLRTEGRPAEADAGTPGR
ncbi:hypothetical protein AB0J21_17375 [Streptomyces sp. NPDC049954]|uniref:hypothetical protein n=1 Tax=Streptomyces sp. NPDC049954 TaxID=3155779 RepID=UPI0034282C94